ncbi:hypothetical protein [Exiguobacterium sp. 9-2]|uniref:hypothetical protein n=1 Tax=Exiguobacterium sp. 9-2 TaxID=3112419 RepID=UPI003FA6112E
MKKLEEHLQVNRHPEEMIHSDYVINRSCGSIEEVREIVGDYISYYNCQHDQ